MFVVKHGIWTLASLQQCVFASALPRNPCFHLIYPIFKSYKCPSLPAGAAVSLSEKGRRTRRGTNDGPPLATNILSDQLSWLWFQKSMKVSQELNLGGFGKSLMKCCFGRTSSLWFEMYKSLVSLMGVLFYFLSPQKGAFVGFCFVLFFAGGFVSPHKMPHICNLFIFFVLVFSACVFSMWGDAVEETDLPVCQYPTSCKLLMSSFNPQGFVWIPSLSDPSLRPFACCLFAHNIFSHKGWM